MLQISPELDPGGFFSFSYNLLNGLNYFLFVFFQYGNYILFAMFIIMGLVLYKSAREKEYDEKVHGKEELVKKRGRAGAAICILLAFGFGSGHLINFFFDMFTKLPEPELILRYVGDKLISVNSLDNLHLLNLYEKAIYLLISFFSFFSFVMISVSIYLMFFNKFIIHSRLNFITILIVGLIFWVLCGFNASFRLLV
ncbi:MAG: hypothetical protein ACFFCV_17270 [Promethearchaeota archaeon]